ncbi:RNA pseudouridine synthase [Haematobacter massiliensis]|uniref:Pseudouridine synthase n=1 Tax=Haematobacter massiliensis TaxID=195105 RepID=A0A086XXJ8_9RHOB|nr:pseudouridine synthase [Haematobacter massiliensis]KFI26748.1 tRNA synthetase RNA-binding protein [Haematobacter massiliensis]OWJ69542.1 RNA pseudouridine synthase [Haematobacter massiliensis]OWJ87637.1 RNA pseudouridine synthase [Haematobacter massiliensis]QBJ23712.1 pseudouridine synthase [Haematobacter massiliensis]
MTQEQKTGERIAKVLARAGIASRRDAERLIAAGAVTVNGRVIDSPALDVTPKDRIAVEGRPLPAAEPPRLWLYYKPIGLVTTERDEKGRETVFENLPEELPRVLSVGRLDLNSEGLLLLTNDGEIKRRLELPSTGWLRRYRVRVNGRPEDSVLDPLRKGIEIEGERFQPMQVVLDRQQGANAWLTVGLREGKNREVRRAMEAVGLAVNRLIRVSYGPFKLEDLEPGEVREVRSRVLRDQLGLKPEPEQTVAITRRLGTKAEKDSPSGKPRKLSAGPRDMTGATDPSRSLRVTKPMPLRTESVRPPRGEGVKPRERSTGDASPRPLRSDAPKPARSGWGEDKPRKPRANASADRGFASDTPRKPRSEGFRSHGGGEGKPRSEGFRSHREASREDRGASRDFPREEGRPRREGGDRPRPQGDDRKPRSGGFRNDDAKGSGERGGKFGAKPRAEGFRSHAQNEERPRSAGERSGKPRFEGRREESDRPRSGGFKPAGKSFASRGAAGEERSERAPRSGFGKAPSSRAGSEGERGQRSGFGKGSSERSGSRSFGKGAGERSGGGGFGGSRSDGGRSGDGERGFGKGRAASGENRFDKGPRPARGGPDRAGDRPGGDRRGADRGERGGPDRSGPGNRPRGPKGPRRGE